MSKMGYKLEQSLSDNHYELLDVCRETADIIAAGFSCNPEIDSPEVHVQYLYENLKPCQDKMKRIINKIEGME